MQTKQQIAEIANRKQGFQFMNELLDSDISSALFTCLTVGDLPLLKELADAIPEGHRYKDIVQAVTVDMEKHQQAQEENEEAGIIHDDVDTIVTDVTGSGTFELEQEADSRLVAFRMALKHLSTEALYEFGAEWLEYVRGNQDYFTEIDSDLAEYLTTVEDKIKARRAS